MVAVENTDAKYAFNFENITELMLGRKDPDADESPPIDLSTVGGREKGVSRKHAMIIQDEGTLSIIDNKSANGTFLNGQKLAPEQPRVLRDGDELRLGHLVIRVSFLSEQ
ncbi:MAG: FHA domain-containing protein [Chloroflexota bacterium]